jgi:hypothetical protein
VDCTLEAVKDVRLTRCDYLKGKVVIISADLTHSHIGSPIL